MDVAVMGSGGVGGYFGALLAKAGNRVVFIARGPHLDAMQRDGLVVKHHQGTFTIPVKATKDPSQIAPVDLVIFAVKTYDTEAATATLKNLIKDDTVVLSLQNGVDSYKILGGALGANYVLPGVAYIESSIESPGVIHQVGEMVRLVFGESDGRMAGRTARIRETIADAGINCEITDDVIKILWTKLLFIAPVAGLTSSCRANLRELMKDAEHRQLLLDAMVEIENVGRAHGVNLEPDVVQQTMAWVEHVAKDVIASMHLDLSRGRRLELDAFNGAVVRLGAEKGVDTPIHKFFYLALKPHVNGPPLGSTDYHAPEPANSTD